MGLHGFYAMLKKENVIPTELSREDLQGKTVAVDGKAWMYKASYHADVLSTQEEQVKHIADAMCSWIDVIKELGAEVIFVCDGSGVPQEKIWTLKKRSKAREMAVARKRKAETSLQHLDEAIKKRKVEGPVEGEKSIQELSADKIQEEAKWEKTVRASRGVSTRMCLEVIEIIRKRGHTCVIAKSEADFALCLLSESGIADYVVADDADLIVSGVRHMVRDFTAMLHVEGAKAKVFSRSAIMHGLGLTEDQFFQLACLLKCDYMPSITGVGPVGALKGIRQHGNIQNFVEGWTEKQKKKLSMVGFDGNTVDLESYLAMVRRTIEIFKSREDNPDMLNELGKPDSKIQKDEIQ